MHEKRILSIERNPVNRRCPFVGGDFGVDIAGELGIAVTGEFLGHDEVNVAAAEAGDEQDAVGVEVGDAVGVGIEVSFRKH